MITDEKTLSNQLDLLLGLARNCFGENNIPTDLIFNQDASAKALLELARFHKLPNLVLEQYSANPAYSRSYADQTAQFLALTAESLRVYQEFQRQKISVALLKGTALAHLLYQKPHLRQFSDIDLLIKPHQFEISCSALEYLGYRPLVILSPKKLAHELKTQHAITFRHTSLGIELDLHWSLVQTQFAIRFEMEDVFRNLETIEVMKAPVETLGIIDTLLFISAHSSKSYWLLLRDSLDFMLAQNKLSQESTNRLIEKAFASGQEILLAVSVEVARSLLRVEPNPILLQFATGIPRASSLTRTLISAFNGERSLSEWELAKIDFQLKSKLRDKISYTMGRIFTPHEQDWNSSIPEGLFFLHFLRKPIKTLLRVAKALSRR